MPEPISLAIAGTLAAGLAQTAGEAIVGSQGDRLFCQLVASIADKFRTNAPPENRELEKAFRRACVRGMQHACSRRKMILGSDTSSALISRPRNALLGETPSSLFGQGEQQWLNQADAYLQKRIDELNRGSVWLPEQPGESYQTLVVPKGNVSNAERADEFRLMLIQDAVAELTTEVGAPPAAFVREMEIGWFDLVCSEFEDAIAKNQLLANKFQNRTLVEIKSDTGDIKFTLAEVLELLREIAGKREHTGQSFVLNLPNLKVEVYDRLTETMEVLRSMCEGRDQFHLVVAPSGFGKSYLLTKVLQNVTDSTTIFPAYQSKVQRIAVFDCRGTKTLAKVVGDFADLLGVRLEYTPQQGESPKEWLNKHLFAALRQAGTVWLVLDNFEAWLDAERGYILKEPEMLVFLNALFEGNHSLRVLCLSQAEPTPDIKKRFKEPPGVGAELYKGLPEQDALAYLRQEGAGVGLDLADEDLLKEFLRRVAYIPQALNSLIGYLATIEDYGFAEFMADTDLWAGFDDYEHERDEHDEGKRRTKALVARQISAQSEEVKLLLRALAFFARPTPREALEIFFDSKTKAAQAISRLTAHRLVSLTEDSRRSKYYELHSYFREQTRKVLPPFENFDEDALLKYAAELAFVKGNEAFNKTYFWRALILRECAEKICRFLYEHKARADVEPYIAGICMNKGTSLYGAGRLPEALVEYDKAITIRERLVNVEGRGELANDLAMAYMNKGNALGGVGRLSEAIVVFDKAITTYERLVNEEGRTELTNDLAAAYTNKGNALSNGGRLPEAMVEYDKAITTYERLVNEEGRSELTNDLAAAYTNKGVTLKNLNRLPEAIAEYDKAITIYERLVNVEGRGELANDLAAAYTNKGNALDRQAKLPEAITEYNKAITIRERLVNVEGRTELANDLAMTYINKALSLEGMRDWENALTSYAEGVRLWTKCVEEFSRIEIVPALMQGVSYRFDTLFKLERWSEAAQDAVLAIRLIQEYLQHPELSEHFKAKTIQHFGRIIRLMRGTSEETRERIYESAGVYGEDLKGLVEGED
ncbi:MAG TPA: tetratricopeptide repeat protein [Pyrinomonadaceae bacterium]|jgi:tetratricopeptide (TPR) repeat protein